MSEDMCFIETRLIDYDPAVPRSPIDGYDIYVYCHLAMKSPPEIPRLCVRFDTNCAKYLIVCEHPTYTNEGFSLECARKLGLSTLPCRVLGAVQLVCEEKKSHSPSPITHSLPRSTPSPNADRPSLGSGHIELLFRALDQELARTTKGVRRRTTRSALRVADDDDWRQEALVALWRELMERDQPRLTCASEARKFVFGLLRKQAARTMKMGGRTSPLPEGQTQSTRSVLDELVAAEADRRLDEAVENVHVLMKRANKSLDDNLSRLPAKEAKAADAWLNGDGYMKAGLGCGLTLAQMRRVIRQLHRGVLASFLHCVRRELERIYRECPSAAARIDLGRLTRLLTQLK